MPPALELEKMKLFPLLAVNSNTSEYLFPDASVRLAVAEQFEFSVYVPVDDTFVLPLFDASNKFMVMVFVPLNWTTPRRLKVEVSADAVSPKPVPFTG